MLVSDINKCRKCNYTCCSIHFQHNFINWTSGNNDIDKFIQSTQLSAHNDVKEVLEWIPYDRFYDIKYIAEGKFNKMYRANWIDGCIISTRHLQYQHSWDNVNQNWNREKPNMFALLEILNNPTSITTEFINKV
jgi:hypothetical protein